MNLQTLPDEMLANVYKYLNFKTISTVRKTNHRMNSIAKTYNIGTRLPVRIMWLYGVSDRFTKNSKTFFIKFDINPEVLRYIQYSPIQENKFPNFRIAIDGNNHLSIIDELLPKLQLERCLEISNFFAFDDQLLTCFIQNQAILRTMTSFKLCGTEINCSAFTLRKFMTCAKKLRKLELQDVEGNFNVFLQASTLENRLWDRIFISTTRHHTYAGLDDDFLLRVVRNCKCFVAMFNEKTKCTAFTADGIIKLMEVLLVENTTPKLISLGTVNCPQVFFQEVEDRIRTINNNPFCSFIQDYYFRVGPPRDAIIDRCRCEITINSNHVPSTVSFTLCDFK